MQPPAHATAGFWSPAEWLLCQDGRLRPTQPGLFPLVDGLLGRVEQLRAYGNAIVPQVAQAFLESVRDVILGVEAPDDDALPPDYEPCGECGFDHAYEPEESSEAHRATETA